MRVKITFLIVIGTIIFAQAQNTVSDDIKAVSAVKVSRHKHIQYKGLLFIYKEFISSQDHANCSFTPSCSEYMSQSIKQHGFFSGMLRGADRLARCNGGLSSENYTIHPETKLLYDPVE